MVALGGFSWYPGLYKSGIIAWLCSFPKDRFALWHISHFQRSNLCFHRFIIVIKHSVGSEVICWFLIPFYYCGWFLGQRDACLGYYFRKRDASMSIFPCRVRERKMQNKFGCGLFLIFEEESHWWSLRWHDGTSYSPGLNNTLLHAVGFCLSVWDCKIWGLQDWFRSGVLLMTAYLYCMSVREGLPQWLGDGGWHNWKTWRPAASILVPLFTPFIVTVRIHPSQRVFLWYLYFITQLLMLTLAITLITNPEEPNPSCSRDMAIISDPKLSPVSSITFSSLRYTVGWRHSDLIFSCRVALLVVDCLSPLGRWEDIWIWGSEVWAFELLSFWGDYWIDGR